MKSTIQQFVTAVRNSGLVLESELVAAVEGLPEDSPADVAAERLIEQGHLTPWQAAMLLRGKAHGFIRGHYRILDHLGSGGMGAVFLAQHTVMGRLVALKLLPKQAATKPAYVKRFLQEAEAVAALDHEHIVRAFDVQGDGDSYFIVLEFIPGDSLGAVVGRDGPLACDVAAECIRQAADGLAYMHSRGIVHRDIKPENLLAGSDRCVKILDLGLARLASAEDHSITLEYQQTVIGTTDFMAPEQALDSHRVDARADIYSLGCTLYFLLTGEAPFPTGSLAERLLAHQYKAPPDLLAKRPECPLELAEICRRMMAKKPEDRLASAAAVRDALADWLRSRDESLDATEVILVPGSSMQSTACSGSLAELGSRANLAEGDLIQAASPPATIPSHQTISTETKLMIGSAVAAVVIVGLALLVFSRPPKTGLAARPEPKPTPLPANRRAFVAPDTTWAPAKRPETPALPTGQPPTVITSEFPTLINGDLGEGLKHWELWGPAQVVQHPDATSWVEVDTPQKSGIFQHVSAKWDRGQTYEFRARCRVLGENPQPLTLAVQFVGDSGIAKGFYTRCTCQESREHVVSFMVPDVPWNVVRVAAWKEKGLGGFEIADLRLVKAPD